MTESSAAFVRRDMLPRTSSLAGHTEHMDDSRSAVLAKTNACT